MRQHDVNITNNLGEVVLSLTAGFYAVLTTDHFAILDFSRDLSVIDRMERCEMWQSD